MADEIQEMNPADEVSEVVVMPVEPVTVYTRLDASGLAQVSGLLTVYNFDAQTGEFTGASEEYVTVGVGIPANSTCDAPPEAVEGKAQVYDNGWRVLDDHRGETVYSTADRSVTIISQPGDYSADTTLLKPATDFDTWNGKKWVTDKAAQQAAIVNNAGTEKAARISEANSKTQAWQTQLLLGIITDEDKGKLTAWMKYIQAVQAIDTSAAPNIVWPVQPS